ncbi:MAG: PD-(D/E)XK nuclease family protein [Limnoraphis sp.]
MNKVWRPYASYRIWLEFEPPIGQEHLQCHMKRGFARALKKKPQVAALLTQDSPPQKIGLLAQQGVYEFHQDPQRLFRESGVEEVAEIIALNQQSTEVQERVRLILKNYHQHPILVNNDIIQINRGDEGIPAPILMREGNYAFNFFAAIDCIVREQDNVLHIIDFKTGKSDFDRRQGYLYLLAAHYLYPNQPAIASFYNLETGKQSDIITAKADTLRAFHIELSIIAKRHQEELKRYRKNPTEFDKIFPANPMSNCKYCPFTSICKFSTSEEIAA